MRESALTRKLIRDGLAGVEPNDVAPAWRRGIGHAIERMDHVLRKKLGPTATVAEIRTVLDELFALQRDNAPATYAEAFRICADDLARALKRKPGEAA